MATATGVWGNSIEVCADKWSKYVQENVPVWNMCNRTSGCKQDNIDNIRSIEKIYGRGACDDSDVIGSGVGELVKINPAGGRKQ